MICKWCEQSQPDPFHESLAYWAHLDDPPHHARMATNYQTSLASKHEAMQAWLVEYPMFDGYPTNWTWAWVAHTHGEDRLREYLAWRAAQGTLYRLADRSVLDRRRQIDLDIAPGCTPADGAP